MAWTVSVCLSVVLLALCGKQQAAYQGNQLSPTGFHLCTRNQSRNVSFLVVRVVSQTVTKSCGGWLPLTTCTVTVSKMVHQTEYKTVTKQVTGCCDGYVQAGHYCALSLNRSREFTTKPGSCPPAQGCTYTSQECELDADCPGWQRCCQIQDRFICTDPTSIISTSEKGGSCLNATVTVKTEYQQLVSEKESLLNHLRLLHAMVSGAMQAESVISYLSYWPVHAHRTATSLLIHCSPPLSLQHVTARLHLLLTHINEVSDVTVQDIDECAHAALNPCSSQTDCNNTVGSYLCVCPQGYLDVDPRNPGTNCSANVSVWTTTERLSTIHTSMSAYTDSPFTQDPEGSITMEVLSTTGSNMTTALSNTSSALYNSSDASLWTSSTPHSGMSSSVTPPEPTTSCVPPSISSLWADNVTGTSFSLCWISQSMENQTFQVVVSNRSEVVFSVKTNQSKMEVTGLKLGLLYNVSVTPSACGNQGTAFDRSIKTDAQTVDVSARLTNIQFTADLQDPNSLSYKDLSQGIIDEIYSSLSQDMKAMVDSGQVTIVITGFSSGSVVVNFNLIYSLNQSQGVNDVPTVLLESLINSNKYKVDENSSRVNDFDECESGNNDCSQEAFCNNTWASYTCECLGGLMDKTPERPGRVCQAITTTTTTTKTTPTAITSSGVRPMVTSDSKNTTISTNMIATTQDSPHTGARTISPTITGTTNTSPLTTASTPTTSPPTTTSTATTSAKTTNSTTTTSATTTTGTITTRPPTTTSGTTTTGTTTTSAMTTTGTTTSPPTTNGTATTSPPTTTGTTTTSPPSTNSTTTTSPPSTNGTTTTSPATTTGTRTTSPPSTNGTTTTSPPTTNGTTTTSPATTTGATTTSPPSTNGTTTTSPPTTTGTTTTSPPTTTGTITTTPPTTTGTITTSPPTTTGTTATTTTSTPTTTGTTTTSALTTTATSTTVSLLKTPRMPKSHITSTIKTTTTTSTSPSPVPSIASLKLLLGDVSVECRDAAMTVTVARSFLVRANIQESALYLGLPECGVNGGNGSHVQLTVGLDECSTTLVQNKTSYTSSVSLYMESNTADGKLVVPKAKLAVPIMCTFMKKIIVSTDPASMGYTLIQENITGFGSFQIIVRLMNGTMPLPQNYSLSSKEAVVLEVHLNTSSELIKLVIDKCWVTASQNSLDANSDTFLENSCALNVFTNVLMNGNSSTSRVSVQIFSFVSLDVIYLHCQVQICLQTGLETCLPDCGQRAARSGKIIGRTFGSFGPIYKEDEEPLEETSDLAHVVGFSCLGVGLMILFIAGFVCLFYYQRNRIGHYNFSNKPKQENFTYLVYD